MKTEKGGGVKKHNKKGRRKEIKEKEMEHKVLLKIPFEYFKYLNQVAIGETLSPRRLKLVAWSNQTSETWKLKMEAWSKDKKERAEQS